MQKKDIKKLLLWSREQGDCVVVERVIVRMMPEFIKANLKVTASGLDGVESIMVDETLYEQVKSLCEELTNEKYSRSKQ